MMRHLPPALLFCIAAGAHAANPIVTDIFTADPAVVVDGKRLYLYTGRDEARPGETTYRMNEWRVFSTCDMRNWTDHGVAATVKTFAWAKADAFAADVVRHKGKYYLYAPVKHATIPGFAIGVGVSDTPTGPFRDARGSALVTNDMTRETPNGWDDIDPAVFVDDDGQAYMYFGNKVLKYVRLKPNMIELDGPIQTVGLFNFEEAPWLHKRDGVYYLSYASGLPEVIAYATGPGPTGPWTYRGVIMDKNKVTHTIHQAFADFNGKSYVFYHNEMVSHADYRRSVAVEEFSYGKDGAIPRIAQTRAGPAANPAPGCNN
ncbi:glycoside hydrolase family 43 protein [Massilia timonae]|uniref:glycoside hydrolase family 43 protein n=1 Tax=Massilia timonae TaxID=47229 RepID=UPI0016071B53|nr:glycoside hydrolase family 43 protein [Massilia timonae]